MQFHTPDGLTEIEVTHLFVAGWTGRDHAKVAHHIAELAAIGVAPPSRTPLFYRTSAPLLRQADSVEVLGPGTSGEVEPLLVQGAGGLWLGLASDHTDRALEAHSVAHSKQVCPKPAARQLWPLADVAGHLDQLVLSCDIQEDGTWLRYQHGTLAAIRPLPELLEACPLPEGGAMLCGTLAAIGGVREARAYRMALTDPVLGREITLAYHVRPLAVVS
ncbi:DUF2848 domain-containing protein [Pseudooceanicola sp. GBMRC 2024]|uniref:DUF2848 domain-containing protein n=1 Tax=Pseudooceanicola albus TaxID=2692189 RepID=A0A6L7G2T4_9RHOB|nr:DUF2848 domain-containing protein [Pseudooceanicola albus]MXN17767.1 DUF2848 domain-containing protein [Pseudooceanicola albus]